MRRAQCVEAEDPLNLGRQRSRGPRVQRVVVTRLSRREPVAVDRRGEGRLHLSHRPGDGERQAGADAGRPTVRPDCSSSAVTCAMVPGVGPSAARTVAGLKKWWYSGELGSDTACASVASADGSRGWSVTPKARPPMTEPGRARSPRAGPAAGGRAAASSRGAAPSAPVSGVGDEAEQGGRGTARGATRRPRIATTTRPATTSIQSRPIPPPPGPPLHAKLLPRQRARMNDSPD